MMRRVAVVLAAFAMSTAVWAQTHVVKKPETVVRAIGIFEWTGEEAKPTASRLVPVTVFINGQLEDAGSYMVRPVPFALSTGTVFEVQKAGVAEGTVELAYERHLEGNSIVQFDSGWMGYGLFKPAAQAPVLAARKSGPLPQIVASGGSKPKLGNRTGDSDTKATGTDTKAADDADRPTMRRRTDSTATADSSAKPPADDPDRPTMRRRSDPPDTSAADSTPADSSASADDKNKPTMRRRTPDSDAGTVSSTDSSDDADRPTLKKRTAPPQGKGQKRPQDLPSVANAVGSLNDDPDRPTLQRGAPSSGANVKGIPPLSGLPAGMAQRVAVSDAADRPEHDFNRQWDSEAERVDIMAKLQQIARVRLAKYDMPGPVIAPATPAPAPVKPAVRGKKPVAPPPPPPPAPVALADEQLRGFTLSYGGAATFVYTATSPGVDGATRYVSVVAQRDGAAEPKVALASVTDSKHLDRAPWMRLVDVVDAEASNRASLLFEMRGQNSRQFALYRVIGAVAEQIFQSGTTE